MLSTRDFRSVPVFRVSSCSVAETIKTRSNRNRFTSEQSTWRSQRQHNYFNKRTTDNKHNIRRSTCLAHGWQHQIGENWHNRARTSGGEYSITTDGGHVRPKQVLMEFRKWMCYIDGQKNKYSVSYHNTGLHQEWPILKIVTSLQSCTLSGHHSRFNFQIN
jgi:hypothetical protein